MRPNLVHQFPVSSTDQTSAFAAGLAHRLNPGDVILLEGSIGAGKTHFARTLIQARLSVAGTIEDVPSPTFTLVQTYEDAICEIWHSDLYRLTHPDELEELGLIDAFANAICLVEWPDRLGDLTPDNALHILFEAAEDPSDLDSRMITVTGDRAIWQDRIEQALSA